MTSDHAVFTYLDVKKKIEMSYRAGTTWEVTTLEPMSSILGRLEQTFAVTDFCNLPRLTLYIDGKKVGHLGADFDAKKIIGFASRSGFGRGTQGVFDESVRKAWEVSGSRISIQSKYPSYSPGDLIVRRLKHMAPPNHKLTTKLHKLAVYESGGHFTKHQDTLHGDNHIASLVIVFGDCEGGDLVIDHDGSQVTLSAASNQLKYAMFFTDCRHEVLPVTAGYRCALQYDVYKEITDYELDSSDDEYTDEISKCIESGRDHGISSITSPNISLSNLEQLSKAILQHLEKTPNVAFLLRHQYRAAAITANHLKGLDAQLYEHLAEDFEVVLTPLLIGNNCDYDLDYDWWAEPFPVNSKLPNKVQLVLAKGDMSSVQQVYHSDYIEHTGNEPQAEENRYFSGAILVKHKSVYWKQVLLDNVLPEIRALPPSTTTPEGGSDYIESKTHFESMT